VQNGQASREVWGCASEPERFKIERLSNAVSHILLEIFPKKKSQFSKRSK